MSEYEAWAEMGQGLKEMGQGLKEMGHALARTEQGPCGMGFQPMLTPRPGA